MSLSEKTISGILNRISESHHKLKLRTRVMHTGTVGEGSLTVT